MPRHRGAVGRQPQAGQRKHAGGGGRPQRQDAGHGDAAARKGARASQISGKKLTSVKLVRSHS